MGAFSSKEAEFTAEELVSKGYTAVRLTSSRDADIAGLENAAATMIAHQSGSMSSEPAAAAATGILASGDFKHTDETDHLLFHRRTREERIHEPLLCEEEAAGAGPHLSQQKAFEKALDSAFSVGASIGLAFIEQLASDPSIGPRLTAILEGVKQGIEAGSGGGLDGKASNSFLRVQHHTVGTTTRPRQACSLLEVALLRVGDSSFQLCDLRTGVMVAPGAAASLAPSSSSSASGKWVLVAYTGLLFDLVCGAGDGELAPACFLRAELPSSASSSASASAVGSKRPRVEAGLKSNGRVSFTFGLAPSANTKLVTGAGAAGSETCAAAIDKLLLSSGSMYVPVMREGAGASAGALMIQVPLGSSFVSFKRKVAAKAGVPAWEVFLFADDRLLRYTDDDLLHPLMLEVPSGKPLSLRNGPNRIWVKCADGTLLPFDVDLRNDNKAGLFKMISEAGHAPPDGLYWRCVASDMWLLDEWGPLFLEDGSVLELVSAPWTVYIERPGHDTLKMQAHPDEGAEPFMKRACRATNVEPKDQFYYDIFGGGWFQLPGGRTTLRSGGMLNRMRLRLYDGQMRVIVELPNGEAISMAVRCNTSFPRLRELITSRTGIAPYDQYLFHERLPLPAVGDFVECHVADRDTIQLRQGPIKITVTAVESGQTFDVFVGVRDTVAALKRKIQDRCGVKPLHQYLKHGDRWLLDDNSSVASAGLDQGYVALQLLPGPMELFLQLSAHSSTLSIRCHPRDNARKLVALIKEAVSCASLPAIFKYVVVGKDEFADDFTLAPVTSPHGALYFKREDGAVFNIDAMCTDSFQSLAIKIFEATGVSPHEQFLTYDGKWIDRERSILWAKIPNRATVRMEGGSVLIKVRIEDGVMLSLGCQSHESIEDVKRKIHARTGIPVAQQSIAMPFGAQGTSWLRRTPRETTVSHHVCLDSSPMRLCHGSINVGFKASAGAAVVPMTVATTDNLDQVLAKVKALTGASPPGLKVWGYELSPGRTLADYGIQPGDYVEPGRGTVNISVFSKVWGEFSVHIPRNARIAELKAVVYEREELAMSKQRVLVVRGQKLDEGRTVEACGLEDGCVVHVMKPLAGGGWH